MRGAHEVRHSADLALGTPVVALSEAAVADTVGCDGIHNLARMWSRHATLSVVLVWLKARQKNSKDSPRYTPKIV